MARTKRMHPKPLHFHVPADIHKRLTAQSKRQGRTVAEIAREMFRTAFDNSK